MVEPRSLEQIHQEYLDALSQTGSGLVIDRVEGSLAYTLSRATAVIAAQQDYQLKQFENSLNLITATGSELDRLGFSFLPRLESSKATGYVLAQSDITTEQINFGATLINLQTGEQYITKASPAATVYDTLETVIPVESKNDTSSANVSAGQLLYAPEHPGVSFKVGAQRYKGGYIGDISGAVDAESDENYRYRLLRYFAQGSASTEASITLRLLAYPNINRVFVKTTAPGLVEIWLDNADSFTDSQLQEVYDYIKPYLVLGVIPVVSQVRRVYLDIDLLVTPFRASFSDLSSLSTQLRNVVESYLNGLGIGSTFYRSQVLAMLRPLVRDVSFSKPEADYTPSVDEIVVPGSIRVSYPLK